MQNQQLELQLGSIFILLYLDISEFCALYVPRPFSPVITSIRTLARINTSPESKQSVQQPFVSSAYGTVHLTDCLNHLGDSRLGHVIPLFKLHLRKTTVYSILRVHGIIVTIESNFASYLKLVERL